MNPDRAVGSPGLARHERLVVVVTSSAGDREDLSIGRLLCPHSTYGPHTACDSYLVEATSPAALPGIIARAEEARAFVRDPVGGRFLDIENLELGAIEPALRIIRGWPGVRDVEPDGFLVDPDHPPDSATIGEKLVNNRTGPPVLQDGFLQAVPGDVVVVEYVQPTGDTLRVVQTVPAPN